MLYLAGEMLKNRCASLHYYPCAGILTRQFLCNKPNQGLGTLHASLSTAFKRLIIEMINFYFFIKIIMYN